MPYGLETIVLADLDALVAAHAGTGGDQLAQDDVLLQADQRIDLALDGGLGQDTVGLLEGSFLCCTSVSSCLCILRKRVF